MSESMGLFLEDWIIGGVTAVNVQVIEHFIHKYKTLHFSLTHLQF